MKWEFRSVTPAFITRFRTLTHDWKQMKQLIRSVLRSWSSSLIGVTIVILLVSASAKLITYRLNPVVNTAGRSISGVPKGLARDAAIAEALLAVVIAYRKTPKMLSYYGIFALSLAFISYRVLLKPSGLPCGCFFNPAVINSSKLVRASEYLATLCLAYMFLGSLVSIFSTRHKEVPSIESVEPAASALDI